MGTCSCKECKSKSAYVFYDRYYDPITKRTSKKRLVKPREVQKKVTEKMSKNREYMKHFEPSKYNEMKDTLHSLGEVPNCIVSRICEFTLEDDRCEGCLLYRGEKLSFVTEGPLTCAACKAEERTLISKKRAKRTFKSLTEMDFIGSPEYVVRDVFSRKKDYYRVKDLKARYDRTSTDVAAAKLEWKCMKVTKRVRKWEKEEEQEEQARKKLKLSQAQMEIEAKPEELKTEPSLEVEKSEEAEPSMEVEKAEKEHPVVSQKPKSKPKKKGKKKNPEPTPVKAVGQFSFFDPTPRPVEKIKAAAKKSKLSSLVVPKIVEDDEEIEELLAE